MNEGDELEQLPPDFNELAEYTTLDWILFYTIEFPAWVLFACVLVVLFWPIDKLRGLLTETDQ